MLRKTVEQNRKVKELVESENLRDPEGFRRAVVNNELAKFLDPALKRANVTSAELENYLSKPADIDVVDVATFLDACEEGMSTTVDRFIFEPCFQKNKSTINVGAANAMANLLRYSSVRVPLRQIKLMSFAASSHCFCLAFSYGFKNYLPHSVFFSILCADLFRVSYNCYDKQYCALYLEMIGGSVSKVADSLLKCVTTMVGITDLSDGPLIAFGTKIMWRNLIKGTFFENLYALVAESK